MDDLVAFLVAALLSLMALTGYYVVQESEVHQQARSQLAMAEAQSLLTMTRALDAYVSANMATSSAFSVQPLSATTLGLPASRAVDALGETLGGYVALPNGQPQSWFVAPAAAGSLQGVTTAQLLAEFGLSDPVTAQAWWGEVASDIAQLSNGTVQGYSYNAVNAAILPPATAQTALVVPGQASPVSGNGAWSPLSAFFPLSGVPYPVASLPAIYAPYQFGGLASDSLNEAEGYWVWYLQLNTAEASSQAAETISESLTSAGWSAICPTSGLTPLYGATSPLDLSLGISGSASAVGPFFTAGNAIPTMAAVPVCLPMPKSAYTAIQANGFSFSSACQASGIGCTLYTPYGASAPAGYTVSCTGTACETENLQDGLGYNPGNSGSDGESTSVTNWASQDWAGAVGYLYGTYLFVLPGGLQYTLAWSAGTEGWENNGFSLPYTVNTYILLAGDQVADTFYTMSLGAGATRQAWSFTTDGDPGVPTDSVKNSNYTVIHLGG